tara:strand:+ start:609 stop:752 length:144 start_codon:yes stop_codon:yes gene_type:complete
MIKVSMANSQFLTSIEKIIMRKFPTITKNKLSEELNNNPHPTRHNPT